MTKNTLQFILYILYRCNNRCLALTKLKPHEVRLPILEIINCFHIQLHIVCTEMYFFIFICIFLVKKIIFQTKLTLR